MTFQSYETQVCFRSMQCQLRKRPLPVDKIQLEARQNNNTSQIFSIFFFLNIYNTLNFQKSFTLYN